MRQTNISETSVHEDKFLCYLDILGFKSRIYEENFQKAYNDIITGIIPDKAYVLSDSIIIISEDPQEVIDNSFSIYSLAIERGLFIRGGLTKGQVDTPQEIKNPGIR